MSNSFPLPRPREHGDERKPVRLQLKHQINRPAQPTPDDNPASHFDSEDENDRLGSKQYVNTYPRNHANTGSERGRKMGVPDLAPQAPCSPPMQVFVCVLPCVAHEVCGFYATGAMSSMPQNSPCSASADTMWRGISTPMGSECDDVDPFCNGNQGLNWAGDTTDIDTVSTDEVSTQEGTIYGGLTQEGARAPSWADISDADDFNDGANVQSALKTLQKRTWYVALADIKTYTQSKTNKKATVVWRQGELGNVNQLDEDKTSDDVLMQFKIEGDDGRMRDYKKWVHSYDFDKVRVATDAEIANKQGTS